MTYEGGCQCGAIRYTAAGPYNFACVCYCRMCQRVAGGPLMAFVRFPSAQLRWSQPPAVFASSPGVERAFCRDCGSSLTYRRIDTADTSLTINSLDDPGAVAPSVRFLPEAELGWCRTLDTLPTGGELD